MASITNHPTGANPHDLGRFSRQVWPRYALRPYQSDVARRILNSIDGYAAKQIAMVFARQSGKDELLAQLCAYLMWRAHIKGGSIITVNPTYRPQGMIGRRRLQERFQPLLVDGTPPLLTEGPTLRLGKASTGFLSAYPQAQARGETASILMIANEAQDISPARRAHMRGDHPRARSATPGKHYALLLDVAGADEISDFRFRIADFDDPGTIQNPRSKIQNRDMTALTVVEVDLSGLDDPLTLRPRYRVVARRLWVGTPHPQLYADLADLADLARNVWQARWRVVDATGVGAGLAGFLQQALPGKVVPFIFTAHSKSQLGWDFLALVESGRYKEYVEDDESDTGTFWAQVEVCRSQVSDAPGRLLRWGIEDPHTHDDLLINAPLCALLDRLDRLDWRPRIARGR